MAARPLVPLRRSGTRPAASTTSASTTSQAFERPAIATYTATTGSLLAWFKTYNNGKPYPKQVPTLRLLQRPSPRTRRLPTRGRSEQVPADHTLRAQPATPRTAALPQRPRPRWTNLQSFRLNPWRNDRTRQELRRSRARLRVPPRGQEPWAGRPTMRTDDPRRTHATPRRWPPARAHRQRVKPA